MLYLPVRAFSRTNLDAVTRARVRRRPFQTALADDRPRRSARFILVESALMLVTFCVGHDSPEC